MRLFSPSTYRCLGLICTLLLASCSTPQTSDSGAYTSGDLAIQSAREMIAQAAQETTPAREKLLLNAATLLADNSHEAESLKILAGIDPAPLEDTELTNYSLLYSRLALADDDYELARQLLENETVSAHYSAMTSAQQSQWHKLRGDLFSLLSREDEAVAEYLALAAQLKNRQQITQVHDAIWQTLAAVGESHLSQQLAETQDLLTAGWYLLALMNKASGGNIDRQATLFNQWQRDNPTHPAALIPPTPLQQVIASRANLPQQVTILLPLSGKLAAAGHALRDGILMAYYQAGQNFAHQPVLTFVDTENADIIALYQQAVNAGAEIVIGPLRKDRLQQLLEQDDLPVPVLALNRIDDTENPHPNLFQLSLSVNDEANQAAAYAWSLGYRSILTITPASGWGIDARNAFVESWQQLGGRLIETTYDNGVADYAPLLRTPLLVQQSEERARRLEKLFGKNLEFTPRRRRDVDAIFLATYPQQGRQIKPTLDFLYVGNMPIYATSQIYSGNPAPGIDKDLEGIYFTALPWTLPGPDNTAVTSANSNYASLLAMGVDSYRLHQWLPLLKTMPDVRVEGLTGTLTLAPQNYIHRTLPWARFRNGSVRRISGNHTP